MKSSLLTIVAVSLSIVANAAAVAWSSGGFTDGFKDPNGNKMNATTEYAINVSFYSDVDTKTLVTSSDSGGVNGLVGSIGNTTEKKFTAEQTYYVKALITIGEYSRETAILSFVIPDTGNAEMNFMTGDGLTNPSGGSNTWGDWTTKGGDVPEPTTCSLLLVGLAGMGLKRLRSRRRKQA